MRNLLTLALALGLAGAVSAQNNDATVTQTGNTNAAEVDQAGGATATVDQSIEGNSADIDQDGASTVILDQSTATTNGGSPTGGHEAIISQVGGDGNLVDLSQSFGVNGAGPKGAHDATISQDGNRNIVAGAANGTSYEPGSQESRSNLSATIDQTGDDNRVDLEDGRNLTVDQDGTFNFVETRGGDTVDIVQDGAGNDAFNLGGNDVTISQVGADNEAFLQGGFAGSKHDVTIDQFGSSNVARADGDPRGGETDVDQDGDFNSATMDYGNPGARDASGVDYSVTQDAGAFGMARREQQLRRDGPRPEQLGDDRPDADGHGHEQHRAAAALRRQRGDADAERRRQHCDRDAAVAPSRARLAALALPRLAAGNTAASFSETDRNPEGTRPAGAAAFSRIFSRPPGHTIHTTHRKPCATSSSLPSRSD